MLERDNTIGAGLDRVRSRARGRWNGTCSALLALFVGCGGRAADHRGGEDDAGRAGVGPGGGESLAGSTPSGSGGATTVGGGAVDGGMGVSAGNASGSAGCGSPDDPRNCGQCGHDCTTLPYVNPERITCVAGECSYVEGACLPGFGHCSDEEGCLDDLTTVSRCGSCTQQCSKSSPLCASPSGAPAACVDNCPVGLYQCDGQCVDLDSNAAHCGVCGRRCSRNNGVERCEDGQCVPSGCLPGFADCSPLGDGCETDLGTFENCARCGDSCATDRAAAHCEAGLCVVECNAGFDSCDQSSPDCETRTNTAQDCGACGQVCAGARPLCSDGRCVAACGGNRPDVCSDTCVDLSLEPSHCGACGVSCEAYQVCSDGACSPRYLTTGFMAGAQAMPHEVAMASDGTIVLSVSFSGVVDFDPGPETHDIDAPSWDVGVVKLDPDGSHAWTRVIGGVGPDFAGQVALSPSGSVLVNLDFNGTVNLDPSGESEALHTSPGNSSDRRCSGARTPPPS